MYFVVLELERNPHWWVHGSRYIVVLKPLAIEIQGQDGLIISFPIEIQKLSFTNNFNKVILIWTDDFILLMKNTLLGITQLQWS